MNSLKLLKPVNKHWAIDDEPDVLSNIYDNDITIAIWQRRLSGDTNDYVQAFLQSSLKVALKLAATPKKLQQELQSAFPEIITANDNNFTHHEFLQNLNELVDMFSCLFDASTVGLRINTLERAMCPRFHVDNVPVRLVTTYGGAGTQWLPTAYADRNKLGPKARGMTDEQSGIFGDVQAIQQLNAGDVALLKGENWEGNEGRGLIHRSPGSPPADAEQMQRRLLITCDLV